MKVIPDLSRVVARILVLLGLLGFAPFVSAISNFFIMHLENDKLDFFWYLEMVGWSFVAYYILHIGSVILLVIGIVNMRRHNF